MAPCAPVSIRQPGSTRYVVVGVVTTAGPGTASPGSSAVSSKTAVSTGPSVRGKKQRRYPAGRAAVVGPSGGVASKSIVSPWTKDATRSAVTRMPASGDWLPWPNRRP